MADTQTPPQQGQPGGTPVPPQGGMSYDEFRQAFQKGQEAETPTPTQPPEAHPVRRFFDRLINGEHGEGFTVGRAGDILRSAGRGAANMVNETVTTLGEGEAAALHGAGQMSPEDAQAYEQQGARKFTQGKMAQSAVPLQIPTDQLLGKRSDDLLAGFTEDATQFMTALALTPGGSGAVAMAARGAAVEATAFDPHGGTMAGLMARIPVSGVRQLGQALMEKPGDSELEVRFKRAAVGIIPGVLIDGLVAGIRLSGNVAKLAKVRAAGGDAAPLEAAVAKDQKLVQEIAEGQHVPPQTHVVAQPLAPDSDVWHIVPTNETPEVAKAAEEVKAEAGATEATKAEPAPSPQFSSPAEAMQQAESINRAINDHLAAAQNADGITPEQVTQLNEHFKKLMTAPTPEDLQDLASGTHFNFSSWATDEQTRAMIESVSHVWKRALDFAQKVGGVATDEHRTLVEEMMGMVPKESHGAFITDALTNGSPVDRSLLLSAGHLVLQDYGRQAASLADELELRPHDPILQLRAQKTANTLVNVQRVVAQANSETGRALRFLQDRTGHADALGPEGLPGKPTELITPAEKSAPEPPPIKGHTEGTAPDGSPAPMLNEIDAAEVHGSKSALRGAKRDLEKAVKGGRKASAEGDAPEAGPNTFTVADESDVLFMARKAGKLDETDPRVEAKMKDLEKQGLNDGTKDTQGVNANDFSRSRERLRALAALKRAHEAITEAGETPKFDPEVLADNRSLRGEKIKNESELQKDNPLETPKEDDAAKGPVNPIEELSKQLDIAEQQIKDLNERRVSQNGKVPKQGQKLPEEVSPVETALKGKDERVEKFGKTFQPVKHVAGMPTREIVDPEEVKTVLRIAKLADGDASALYGVGKAAQVIHNGGTLNAVMEVGINSMLSGIPTASTVHIMGTLTTMYHLATKLVGSGLALSPQGMREAVDQLVAGERYSVENLKVARMAFAEGRSVINPVDVHEAIPGVLGDLARVPSKVLTASEEFTRVTNYRSEIYAKSLRQWRERGLTGQALAQQVSKDLEAAFSPEGIATIPAALARADAMTFRNKLQPGSFGSDLNNFMNKRFATKLISPFIRTSINMARWQFERTPMLNLALQRSRDVLLGKAGREAAGQLWTQTAVSGWMAYYAYTHAAADNLTGRGPADPATRPLWLQDHKPYSIKIDGHWVSYQRGDPILQPLGIFADIHQIAQEVEDTPERHKDASDILFASVAGLAMSLGDKTYMRSMTDFFEAWSGGKSEMLKRWAYGEGAAMVPYGNFMRTGNKDPYIREVNSFVDEIWNTIPGLSEKLPAKYDMYGNPISRTHSLFPFKDQGEAKADVGTELMKLQKSFAPLNKRQIDGLPIDLTDRQKFNDGPTPGMSPYERAMQLLREPRHGKPLQDQLRDLVASGHYQNASPGSVQFPGGERWRMAAEVIQASQRRALAQVQHEYPSLRNEMKLQRQIKGASLLRGQEGANRVLDKAQP